MNTRSKRPAGAAPKTPSPKRSAAKTDVDDSPQCVAAAAVVADGTEDPADDREIAATDSKDDDKAVVSGSNQSDLRRDFDNLRDSSPSAPRSLMALLPSIPSKYNIFDPPKGSVAFVVYSTFVYFSPVVMRVIRTALLWYEHEFNHQTSANWSADDITVIVADSTEEMMLHPYVRDNHTTFLSIDDVHKPITVYPPLKPTINIGSGIVTVTDAKLRDVSESPFDGTAGSLRADLLSPSHHRYVSRIFSILD